MAAELVGAQRQIERALDKLGRDDGLRERNEIGAPFSRGTAALWQIFDSVRRGDQDATAAPSSVAAHEIAKADQALQRAAKRYHRDSQRASAQASIGSAAVILVLFAAFASFYWRAAAARERAESLARREPSAGRRESRGGPHRRSHRSAQSPRAPARPRGRPCCGGGAPVASRAVRSERLQALQRHLRPPGGRRAAGAPRGAARDGDGSGRHGVPNGGDEFCVLAPISEPGRAEAITRLAAAALAESGVGFRIGSSHGAAVIPTEARGPSEALALADQRMYAHKTGGRVPASRSSAAR